VDECKSLVAGAAAGVVASGSTGAGVAPGTESVISVVATAAMAPEAGA